MLPIHILPDKEAKPVPSKDFQSFRRPYISSRYFLDG
jgi:hypothetical protein